MKSEQLEELNAFLGKAALATYAGGGPEAKSQRKGFKELIFEDGEWEYRDSYTGFFQSWGQEVVWYQGNPVWTQLYGGGMTKKHHGDAEYADTTFDFLKQALSAGEKQAAFQPRGPKELTDGKWRYTCKWRGDLTVFKGSEEITHNNEIVFTHDFFGGLVLK